MQLPLRRFVATSLGCAAVALTASAATVTPVNHGEPLVNPDMGLVMFHYSNRQWAYGQMQERGDVLDWFPGTSCVYFRLPWCLIEPQEGKFRWDVIDSYARPWIAAGKQIGIRITCCEARYPFATPEWVKNAGAKGWFFRQSKMHEIFGRDPSEGSPELWEPDYGDPVFLAKLENLLRAMSRRYDGKPYVAFIDIGSVGMYGEGHTRAYKPELLKQGRDPELAFHRHYELFKKHFPRTTVLCIDDQAGGGWNPHPDPALMRHARELGFGFRDDSILVAPPPNSWKHANWAKLFTTNAPVFIENEHYNLSAPRGAWSDDLLVKSIEDNRATWLSLHGWPRELFEKAGDAYRRAACRIGYRFELRKVTYPAVVRLGEPVEIGSTWVNVGVARRYRGAFLTWTLLDAQGRVAWSVTDESYDFAAALPKIDGVERPATLKTSATFGYPGRIPQFNDGVLLYMQAHDVNGYGKSDAIPTLEPGRYTLAVSLGDAAGVPTLNLPLPNGKDRLYPIGPIEVRAPAGIRVGSYNIRLSSGDRGTPNDWELRKADLVALVKDLDLDVFGMQEVRPDQAAYLRENLSDFAFVGDHRGADRKSDEASPVFYRKSRFEVEKSGTFWLSETPEVPASKSWETACPRVCSYLVLRDGLTGKRLCFANTHTDHRSERARTEGMKLILARMAEFSQGAPIVFTGDHNCPYESVPAASVREVLKDGRDIAERLSGPRITFQGFGTRNPGSCIDYIYVSDGVRVLDFATHGDKRPGTDLYPSDHFPVTATVVLP